jgi:hypothetical protein
MDAELAHAAGRSPRAVLGLMEFKVRASKLVASARVSRSLVVRRQYRVSDPIGPCASADERKKLGLLASMVHLNPLDLYRDIERSEH